MGNEKAVWCVEAAIDQDIRLLVLTANITLDQFESHFTGIKTAIARRAVRALDDGNFLRKVEG